MSSKSASRGVFVAIEGIEGSGKSTLRTALAEIHSVEEREIVVTREPGATPLGHHLRTLLLDPSLPELDPIAELLLFSADRAQHVKEVIRPALARGAMVICDRYIHSTLAYQGYGRGLPVEKLWQLINFSTTGLLPDIVLLLDLDPQLGLARAEQRARRASGTLPVSSMAAETKGGETKNADLSWNRFEQEEIAFHTKVRQGFLELANDPKNKIVVLDASKDPNTLLNDASAAISALIS